MTKFYFAKFLQFFLVPGFILAANFSFAQLRADGTIMPAIKSEGHQGITNKTMNSVVCPPVAGITCTINGPSTSSYLGAPAGCNAGSFAGSNPWDGGSSAGFVSWAFSAPIKGVTLRSGSVNTNDFATHSFSGGSGGTITISGLVCLSSLAGMTIGVFTGACCGDVAWTLNSTGTFTFVNLANTGGQSGWIAECPTFITVLPIELLSFDGICSNDDNVILKWKTITESNNDYFTIERSKDAQSWESLGNVKGAGTSSSILEYDFTDKRSLPGISYYRLKQTDFGGEFIYSPLTTVENCHIGTEVFLYPNPASAEVIVKNNSETITTVEVYNMLGLKVSAAEFGYGENKFDISELRNGTYFFKIIKEGVVVKVNRMLIENK